MYLLGRDGGYSGQEALWHFFEQGGMVLHYGNDAERLRMRESIARYRDAPWTSPMLP